MSTSPEVPVLQPGRYRHYKGNEYEVLAVALHSETQEPLVVYRALYGAFGLWVRPYAMFCESVTVDGRTVPRFARFARVGDGSDHVFADDAGAHEP